jgi:F-type H+-transporting ATPase subunit beta
MTDSPGDRETRRPKPPPQGRSESSAAATGNAAAIAGTGVGKIRQVIGAVVDVQFDGHLPRS